MAISIERSVFHLNTPGYSYDVEHMPTKELQSEAVNLNLANGTNNIYYCSESTKLSNFEAIKLSIYSSFKNRTINNKPFWCSILFLVGTVALGVFSVYKYYYYITSAYNQACIDLAKRTYVITRNGWYLRDANLWDLMETPVYRGFFVAFFLFFGVIACIDNVQKNVPSGYKINLVRRKNNFFKEGADKDKSINLNGTSISLKGCLRILLDQTNIQNSDGTIYFSDRSKRMIHILMNNPKALSNPEGVRDVPHETLPDGFDKEIIAQISSIFSLKQEEFMSIWDKDPESVPDKYEREAAFLNDKFKGRESWGVSGNRVVLLKLKEISVKKEITSGLSFNSTYSIRYSMPYTLERMDTQVQSFSSLASKTLEEQVGTYFSDGRSAIFKLKGKSPDGQSPKDFDTTRVPRQNELSKSIDLAVKEYESSFKRKKRVEKLFSKFIISDKFPEIQKLKQEFSE